MFFIPDRLFDTQAASYDLLRLSTDVQHCPFFCFILRKNAKACFASYCIAICETLRMGETPAQTVCTKKRAQRIMIVIFFACLRICLYLHLSFQT
jgi:hypothetical protein